MNLLILTPATSFSQPLSERLRSQFPGLIVELASDARSALSMVPEADGLLTVGSALSDEVLKAAVNLRWIQSLGTGVDGIIDRPTLAPEVHVTNARGLFDDAVSECGLALMLALARDLPRLVRNQAEARWAFWIPKLLAGKRIGIVGLGAIGTTLGRKCQALGMEVVGVSNREAAPGAHQMFPYERLADAAAQVHFLVLTAALTPQTQGLVDRRILSAMRPDAYLVNLGRGAMVVEEDLRQALLEERIAGAAIDAFVHEPLPPDSPLWSIPNLIVSPHLAGPNDSHLDRVLEIIASNLHAIEEGRVPHGLVNVVARPRVTRSVSGP